MLLTRLFTMNSNIAGTQTCAVDADVKNACVNMVDSKDMLMSTSDGVISMRV